MLQGFLAITANEQAPFDTLRYSGCLFTRAKAILFSKGYGLLKMTGKVVDTVTLSCHFDEARGEIFKAGH